MKIQKIIFLAACSAILLLPMLTGCRSFSGGLFTSASNASLHRQAEILMEKKPDVRFGVIDFTDASGNFTAIGIMVGDETLYRLQTLRGIKIIERHKLHALLKEAKLSESGMNAETSAQKIGKVLPVDILVSGSYLTVGERIRVNGRFTDVHTGEIKGTFLYFLDTPRSSSSARTEKKDKENCETYEAAIEPFLVDLSTPAKIERAVDEAVKIPYSYKCRKVHHRVMRTFIMGKIYPEKYYNFLHDTVVSIQDPKEKVRKDSVLYYFLTDENLSDREFNTALLSMYVADDRVIMGIVSTILNTKKQNLSDVKKKCDLLLSIADEGVIGRPHILTREEMFMFIFRSGIPSGKETVAMRKYMHNKYSDTIKKDDRTRKFMINIIESTITSWPKDKKVRSELYKILGEFLSDADLKANDKTPYRLIEFFNEVLFRYSKKDRKEIHALAKKTTPILCFSTTQIQKDYRIKKYGLPLLDYFKIQCKN